ncbi:MAG: hypothetical protein ACXV9P_04850 [Acidimicrobiia bacterium]
MDERDAVRGRPMAIDQTASSTDLQRAAFLARPEGAPIYHGFPLVRGADVDGFQLGKISDFEAEEMDYGDACVIAPDGSRAGLVWEIGEGPRIKQVLEPDAARWGVWAVWFTHPMRTPADALANLREIVPLLRPRWEATRERD